jgi:hypothetical protein
MFKLVFYKLNEQNYKYVSEIDYFISQATRVNFLFAIIYKNKHKIYLICLLIFELNICVQWSNVYF